MSLSASNPSHNRSGLLAAFLSSLLPGAGQWYAGSRRRGLLFATPLIALIIVAVLYKSSVSNASLLATLVQPRNLAGLIAGNIVLLVWRLYSAADAYWIVSAANGGSALIWAGLGVLLIGIAGPHVIAGSYTWRTINLLNNVFVSDNESPPSTLAQPDDESVPDPAINTPLDDHEEVIERQRNDDVTVLYRSVGLIFKDGVGDPDAIAVQRELRAGTPSAPFVEFGQRVDEDRITILLAGGDRGPGRGGLRTDTMIVATVNVRTGQAALFGLPRNLKRVPLPVEISHSFDELALEVWEWEPDEDEDGFPDDWVDLDGDEIPDMPELECHCFPDLLNHLHGDALELTAIYPNSQDPGMDALAATLGHMIGLHIDYWMLVDMRGFVRLIDAMGGVDVIVTNGLHVGVSPSEEGLPTAIVNVEPGPAHLTGSEALAYVRWRKGSSDYIRMQRQRCLLRSVAAGADPVTMLRSFTAMADAIESSVVTNIPLSFLPGLVEIIAKIDLDQIATVGLIPPHYTDGRTPGKYPIPDVDRMRAKVAQTLAEGVQETALIGTEGECGI